MPKYISDWNPQRQKEAEKLNNDQKLSKFDENNKCTNPEISTNFKHKKHEEI